MNLRCPLLALGILLCLLGGVTPGFAGDEFAICTASGNQQNPAISDSIIVWEDDRNYDHSRWDIYGYDLLTGQEFPICTGAYDQRYPRISGNIVVWEDSRNGAGLSEIYGYDLDAEEEFPVCTVYDISGEHTSPDVSGDIVVWQRGSYSINGYDVRTAERFEVYVPAGSWYVRDPAICGDMVVWGECRGDPCKHAIYGRELPAGPVFAISPRIDQIAARGDQMAPDISQNIVVWEESGPPVHLYDGRDIYAYDLASEQETTCGFGFGPAVSREMLVWKDHRDDPDTDIYGYDLISHRTFRVPTGSGIQATAGICGRTIVWADDRNRATTGWDVYGIVIDGPGHDLSLTVEDADPFRIPSGGTTQLSAIAEDTFGHSLRWSWRDIYVNDPAGGIFSPSPNIASPTYTPPWNLTGADTTIALEVTVTCDGTPQLSTADTISVLVTWDYDGDTMPDYWEFYYGFDLLDSTDAGRDPDNDGMSNAREYAFRIDPYNRDTDADGYGDGEEAALQSDPADGQDIPETGHFADVPPGHWAFHEVESAYRTGIVFGYLDGLYRPEYAVTRDQMAVYISRALVVPSGDAGVPDGPGTPTFDDVATDYWAYKYIEYAVDQNIVAGYEGNLYQPTWQVTRGQMAVFVARALVVPSGDAGVPAGPAESTFPDVTLDNDWAWCYNYVEYIAQEGVTQGYPDGLYHPEYDCTRDQMAIYMTRAFNLPM